MHYSKNPQVIDKELDDGLLLFDTDSGKMMELNRTAKLLWQKSGAGFVTADLKRIITENCTGAANVDADIADFIKTAVKLGLVKENGKD